MPFKRPPPVATVPVAPPPGPAQVKEGSEGRKDGWTNSGSWFVINGEMKANPTDRGLPPPREVEDPDPLSPTSKSLIQGTAEMTDIHPEDLEDGKSILGSGASGVVSLTRHKKTGKFYAVKVVHFGNIVDKGMLEQEIRQLELSSTFVVRAYTAFMENRSLHIVQEFMDLGSLADVLKKVNTIPEAALKAIAFQLFSGLFELHNGVHRLHRDLKPGNLLVNASGEVKIADFGIATTTNTVGKSTFVGTTTYMSPERIQGGRYGTASDVWSAGLLLVECALGRFPFQDKQNFIELLLEITGTEQIEIPDSISADGKDFLWACTRQLPADRPVCGDLLRHRWLKEAHQGWTKEAHAQADPAFRASIREFLLCTTRFGANFDSKLAVECVLPFLALPWDYKTTVRLFTESAGLQKFVG